MQKKILRKNLKLVRDSLVNTFEIARHLKAVIVDITKSLKGKDGKGGGLLGGLIKSFLGGLFGGALIAALPFLLKLVNNGYSKTLKSDSNFLAGLNVYKGQVTYKAVADAFGHTYYEAKELLN